MTVVKEIVPTILVEGDTGIILGGQTAEIVEWPVNPDGEPLLLVASFDCARVKSVVRSSVLPDNGMLYVFSTYSKSEYFLENITYSGDPSELAGILSGYTKVVYSQGGGAQSSPVDSIPRSETNLIDRIVGDDDFPVFSMISDVAPRGIIEVDDLNLEYGFFCQLYSSDFSEPFKDIFYLTDAVGYVFLKRDNSGEGLFFVQTA